MFVLYFFQIVCWKPIGFYKCCCANLIGGLLFFPFNQSFYILIYHNVNKLDHAICKATQGKFILSIVCQITAFASPQHIALSRREMVTDAWASLFPPNVWMQCTEFKLNRSQGSGVTTMGSDRDNPGAPNLNGPNGAPQAQAIEQKHWPGPLICYNVVF